jgi:hypothetical protein
MKYLQGAVKDWKRGALLARSEPDLAYGHRDHMKSFAAFASVRIGFARQMQGRGEL